MPTIEVDDDVFEMLQQRARPLIDTASDVIRRLVPPAQELASSAAQTSAGEQPASPALKGKLRGLIDAGLVAPGDRVIHLRKRSGEMFVGEVTTGGCIKVPGVERPFREPSPALRSYTVSQIDGWAFWTHERTGRSLRDLRDNG